MDESLLTELIQKTVEATSGSNESDYTMLAAIILFVFGVFAVLTKYMASQIIKHQEDSEIRRENIVTTIKDDVGQHGIELGRHDERISNNEKEINNLWSQKQTKKV